MVRYLTMSKYQIEILGRAKLKKALMVSTSGIRGIVGGGLDPVMITKYAASFGTWLKKGKVVVGRDSRPSGELYKMAVISGLRSVGIDVIDLGIVPTPTVEIAVTGTKSKGGICITASHNPSEWNALKFFNAKGEFIVKKDLEQIKKIFEYDRIAWQDYKRLGKYSVDNDWIDKHIKAVLRLKEVNKAKVKRAKLKIVIDAINSAGSFALPELLEKLGVEVVRLNCLGDGDFVHKPEPIPANLRQLGAAVKKFKADCGMACDPDADRLALVDETGRPIGEELTLALSVKHVLKKRKGNVVINLSTSRVTEDMATEAGSKTYYTPVGEANVITGMRKHRAVIGGEGNGGVIFPSFHAGRDSLVGAGLIATLMAEEKQSLSKLAGSLPIYYTIKSKAAVPKQFEKRLKSMEKAAHKSFGRLKIDRRDGLRFDFDKGWFQIRKSNTEPIYRLIVETDSLKLSRTIKREIESFF